MGGTCHVSRAYITLFVKASPCTATDLSIAIAGIFSQCPSWSIFVAVNKLTCYTGVPNALVKKAGACSSNAFFLWHCPYVTVA